MVFFRLTHAHKQVQVVKARTEQQKGKIQQERTNMALMNNRTGTGTGGGGIVIEGMSDHGDFSVSLAGGDNSDHEEHTSSHNSIGGESSSNGGTSTGHSTSPSNTQENLRREMLKEEERNVKRSKIIVIIVFLLVSCSVTFAVYKFAQQIDQQRFEVEYEGYTKDIQALVKWEVRYNFALMEQLR